MKTKSNFQFLAIVTILSLLISMPRPALAEGLTINVPGDQSTIQAAIDAATSGDIVNIAAGTYVENVIVNKSVTIMGAGAGNTIIQPAVSNPNPCTNSSLCGGAASNVFLIQANDVVIHDLTVDGDNPGITSGIVRTGGSAPADLDARNGIIKNTDATYNGLEVYNVTVQNIYLRGIYSTGGSFNFHHNIVTNVQGDGSSIAMFAWYGPGTMANNTVSYANDAISANHSNGIQFLNNTVSNSGSGVHTDNSGDGGGVADLIQGNTVTDCTASLGGYGIWTFVPYLAPTVDNNIITNCDVGLSAWGQGSVVTTQFTNNTVTGPAKKVGSVGAYITTDWISYGYSDISINFTGNVITNYETGVFMTADQQSWNPQPYVAKTINAVFHDNQIFGNTSGVDKGTGGTIVTDFTNNWWGSETGPTASDNPGGTGDTVASGIDYSPWYIDAARTSLVPVHNVTKDLYYLTIQAAIDAASPGDTINISAGTYDETINIDTRANLTLVGENAATTIIKPSTTLAWNVASYGATRNTVLRVVNSSQIAISGLTFDLDLVKGNNVFGGLYWDSTGTLSGNIFRNNSIPDASGGYSEFGVYLRAPSYTSLAPAEITLDANTFADMGRVSIITHDFVNAIIQGNTIYKTLDDFGYGIELGSESTGVISGNTFYGFDTPAASDNSNSAAIYVENAFTYDTPGALTKNVTISNNEVYGSQWALYLGNEFDGYAANVGINATISDNNFHDNMDGAILVTDEDKSAGSSVTAIFTNNTLINNGDFGYYLYTWGDGALNVNIRGGSVSGHDVGVYMNDFASGPTTSTYNVAIERVQITNNTSYGIQNDFAGATINASPVWWGSASGPAHSSNPTGTGDDVSNNVTFDPWCVKQDCTFSPPQLPSSFYGEIHFSDGAPVVDDLLEAYIDGVTGPAASVAIWDDGGLVYAFDIPGDDSDTPAREGGTEGDTITFKVNGRVVATGIWHSGTHVALNIHPPQAIPGGPYSGDEGAAISFNGSANDWGNDANTYEWDWDNNGTYDETGQTLSRTWPQDGIFTVGLKVTDLQNGVGTATVAVTVNNVPPTVDAGGPYSGSEDAPISFAGTASDPVDTLTYEWDFDYDGSTFNADASGSLNATHTYAVPATYTVALRVTDDDTSAIDTAVVTVSNVNDAPVITGQDPLSTNEDVPLTITLNDLAVDDIDNTYPDDFTLTVLPGTDYTVDVHTITPTLNFNGALTVPVKVNDGNADSNTFDLTVTVNAVNDLPVATPQSLTTVEDTDLPILLAGSDIEGSSLTFEVTVDPINGSLTGDAPNLVYTPDANYFGADSFKFRVYDGTGYSEEATVNITVTPVNDAPVITNQVTLSTNEDTPLTITLADLTVTDVDNTYPTGFSLTVQGGADYTVAGNIITPVHNFHGTLTIPVQVNDGAADSNVFNVSVTVVDVLPSNPNAGGPYTVVSGQPVTLTGSATCAVVDICTYTWDLDNDSEYDDATGTSPTYTWYTVGDYTVGMKVTDDDGNAITASAVVTVTPVTHNITLVPGWNLVSFNVHPTNTGISSVLSSVEGNFDLVYAWDATGAHSISGNWLKYDNIPFSPDSLATLDETMGFWIHMTAADTLDVAGSIPTTTHISLLDDAGGWNLVAYPSAANGSLPGVLVDNGVGTDFTLVYAYHAAETIDPWKLFDRNAPLFANDLPQLTSGWGYWIKVSADRTWDVTYAIP